MLCLWPTDWLCADLPTFDVFCLYWNFSCTYCKYSRLLQKKTTILYITAVTVERNVTFHLLIVQKPQSFLLSHRNRNWNVMDHFIFLNMLLGMSRKSYCVSHVPDVSPRGKYNMVYHGTVTGSIKSVTVAFKVKTSKSKLSCEKTNTRKTNNQVHFYVQRTHFRRNFGGMQVNKKYQVRSTY